MGSQASVLLVGHDASRSGAPTAALSWLHWAQRENVADVAVLLAAGGPLLEDYRLAAPTTVVGRRRATVASGSLSSPLPAAVATGAGQAAFWLSRRTHPRSRPPIVVANTVAAWTLAASVRRRSRLVLWLHELDHTVERIISPEQQRRLLAQTDHIIAVGPAVATMVTQRWKVPAAKMSEIPSFIDPTAATGAGPTGAHDLVAIGSLSARKGPDIFVAVAAEVARIRGPIRAAWVGGPLEGPDATMLRSDLAEACLEPPVELPGEVSEVNSWLPRHGVLVHVAREDPAPLVVLEAALQQVPVISWASTGAAEVATAAARADLTVAPGDVAAMAHRVAELLDNPDEHERAGHALAKAAGHRTTEVVAPRLQGAIVGVGS